MFFVIFLLLCLIRIFLLTFSPWKSFSRFLVMIFFIFNFDKFWRISQGFSIFYSISCKQSGNHIPTPKIYGLTEKLVHSSQKIPKNSSWIISQKKNSNQKIPSSKYFMFLNFLINDLIKKKILFQKFLVIFHFPH